MVSLWAEPGEVVSSVHEARARGEARALGHWVSRARRRSQEEGVVTLGEEVSFVLPTSYSKDPVDLVWVGRIEEVRLPRTLGIESGFPGRRVPKSCQPLW